MSARTRMVLTLALLALGGCKVEAPPTAESRAIPGDLPPEHPPVELPVASRKPRRMSVDQMLASVYAAASDDGSITWSQDKDSIKKTLGKPDYIAVTEEDLEPTTLYMKFVDDLAREVCNKMVAKPVTDQVLMKEATKLDTLSNNPAAVKANLRRLHLRFFGRVVAESDEASLAPLLGVFDQVVKQLQTDSVGPLGGSTPATEGWRAVCQAAFTSPEFHLY